MVRVRDGDLGALSTLFERHHRRLYSFCHRMVGERDTSEDMVQEVFLRTLRYRRSYQAGNNFSAWILQIARNVVLASQDKKEREQAARISEAESHPPVQLETSHQQVRLERVKDALQLLAPEKREVLLLSRYGGLRYSEIGAELGLTEGAVKVRVFRAMQDLRTAYQTLSEGEPA
jgi:RNA polymerase sigma factor (sigma-70 family)